MTEDSLSRFKRNPPADVHVIRNVELEAGFSFPQDYVRFLQEMDGGIGVIGSTYVNLWCTSDLLESNRGYEVADFAPQLFLFGSNGGGEAYAFDMREDPWPVIRVPLIGLDYPISMGISFTAFWEMLLSS